MPTWLSPDGPERRVDDSRIAGPRDRCRTVGGRQAGRSWASSRPRYDGRGKRSAVAQLCLPDMESSKPAKAATETMPPVMSIAGALILAFGLCGPQAGCRSESTLRSGSDGVVVAVSVDCIAPLDGERLVAIPLETELREVAGIEVVEAHIVPGMVGVLARFRPGSDPVSVLAEAEAAVNRAKPGFPAGAKERLIVLEGDAYEFPPRSKRCPGEIRMPD